MVSQSLKIDMVIINVMVSIQSSYKDRQVVAKVIGGNLLFLEKKPIQVAKIPITGNALHESIIVHPRYAGDLKHKIIDVEGYRYGRTIDILLKEPMVIDGKAHYLLNFKNCGARTDREMVIHPTRYYLGKSLGELSHTWGYSFDGRTWGTMEKHDAIEEFYNDEVLRALKMPSSPHVTLLHYPKELVANIVSVENASHETNIHGKKASELELSQMVRAFSTNVRACHDAFRLSRAESLEIISPHTISPDKLADMDAKIISAQFAMFEAGKEPIFSPNVAENRFIDGTFTDAENYDLSVKKADEAKSISQNLGLIDQVLMSSAFLLQNGKLQEYVKRLGQRLGMDFQNLAANTYYDIYVPIAQAFEKKLNKKIKGKI